MADQISIPSLVQSIKLADNTKNPRLALKLWLDDYDSDKGYPVSIRNISEFRLRESMFLNLPIGQFTYVDDGTAKSANTFYDGRLLYVGFEYASSDDNAREKNISKGRYRIVGSKIQNRGQNSVIYVITFIYDALALVNSVPTFPESRDDCYCQSTEAMKLVCASCGLPFTTNVDTTDQMAWFNPSLNARRFIQFIVNHSFINETDFGMFWVNKSGDAFFYGIRADLQNGIPFYFDNNVNKNLRDKKKHLIFTDVFAKDTENLSDDELKSKYENRMYILFDEDQRNDDGWVSDFYGNSVQVGVYDPMGRTALYKSDDMTFDWAHMTHKITGKTIQPGTPSTDTTNRNRVREQLFAGYSSVDFTHAAWDFAPVQNSIMRSEFFDNRHTIKINTGKQLKNFGDQELRIGDVLDIDFSMYEKDMTIDNGDYIVHSIDWRFQHGSDLFLVIRVASDSLHPTENETPTQNQKK